MKKQIPSNGSYVVRVEQRCESYAGLGYWVDIGPEIIIEDCDAQLSKNEIFLDGPFY